MSLRDKMATEVLAALVANPTVTNAQTVSDPGWSRSIAKLAWNVTDRALERRGIRVEPDPPDKIK